MQHEEAKRLNAAERYVAGQLSEEQRDAFEEHYFDCRECADEVRMEQVFAANMHAVLPEFEPSPVSFWEGLRGRFDWSPALAISLAANALAVVLAVVFFNGDRHDAARFLPSYYAPGPSHGAGEAYSVPAGSESMLVRVPAPTESYSSYSYEVLSADNKVQSRGSAAPQAGDQVDLYLEVPVRRLSGGDYTLVLTGNPGNRVVSQSKFHISR